MTNFLNTLNHSLHAVANNLPLLLMMLAGLWLIHFANYLSKYRLNHLGIIPRQPVGLFGIVFSPLLHGSVAHLMINSIMLFALSAIILLSGRMIYYEVSLSVIIISGALTWLLARRGLHIGASGVVMGYFGFILANGIHHPSALTIIVTVVCLYYFSGLFVNLFPGKKEVSWEGHVFGFIAGVTTSFLI